MAEQLKSKLFSYETWTKTLFLLCLFLFSRYRLLLKNVFFAPEGDCQFFRGDESRLGFLKLIIIWKKVALKDRFFILYKLQCTIFPNISKIHYIDKILLKLQIAKILKTSKKNVNSCFNSICMNLESSSFVTRRTFMMCTYVQKC